MLDNISSSFWLNSIINRFDITFCIFFPINKDNLIFFIFFFDVPILHACFVLCRQYIADND